MAVLEQAVADSCHPTPRIRNSPSGRGRGEARAWILSNVEESVFDFVLLCETLGLHPQAIREELQRRWRAYESTEEPRPIRLR